MHPTRRKHYAICWPEFSTKGTGRRKMWLGRNNSISRRRGITPKPINASTRSCETVVDAHGDPAPSDGGPNRNMSDGGKPSSAGAGAGPPRQLAFRIAGQQGHLCLGGSKPDLQRLLVLRRVVPLHGSLGAVELQQH